jgi:predicted CopG family antitoxin
MVKTITIKENVYRDLVKVKNDEESFSDLFERLIKSANPIDVLVKIRGSVEFKNKRKMLSELYAKRAEVRT